jgi:hypothetical protein
MRRLEGGGGGVALGRLIGAVSDARLGGGAGACGRARLGGGGGALVPAGRATTTPESEGISSFFARESKTSRPELFFFSLMMRGRG